MTVGRLRSKIQNVISAKETSPKIEPMNSWNFTSYLSFLKNFFGIKNYYPQRALATLSDALIFM